MRVFTTTHWLCILPLIFLLAACQPADEDPADAFEEMAGMIAVEPEQEGFWNHLVAFCGLAFEGTGDDEGRIIHIRHCRANEIQIPMHLGDDRSRTWILSRHSDGLRLKHDHRERDGSESEVTQYGGDTQDAGTPTRQRFHADAHTGELVPRAADNVWTVEIDPEGDLLAYELTRDGETTVVRWEFDLSRPVDPPPAPWGYEDTEPTH